MNGIDISYDGNAPTVSVTAPSQKSSTPIDCNGLAESAIGKILDRAEDEYFDSGKEAAEEEPTISEMLKSDDELPEDL